MRLLALSLIRMNFIFCIFFLPVAMVRVRLVLCVCLLARVCVYVVFKVHHLALKLALLIWGNGLPFEKHIYDSHIMCVCVCACAGVSVS